MALTSLSPNVNGTPLPNTPTTGQYFRYQGPDAEITPEAIARVKKLHELYPHVLGPYIEGKRNDQSE